jgi:transmembrane sensor
MNASTPQTIAQQAGSWVFRLKEDTSARCRAEFAAWLQTSPQHVAEFLLATATDVDLGSLDSQAGVDVQALLAGESSSVVPLADAPWRRSSASAPPSTTAQVQPGPLARHGPAQRHRRSRRSWIGAAAGVASLAVLTGVLWREDPFDAWMESRGLRTAVGEQRMVKLDDGSMVQLNTRSHIEVEFTAETRLIRLLEGEALFTVVHEPARPFVVRSGSAAVQAVGTRFNVYRHGTGHAAAPDGAIDATVTVLEGRVKIEAARPADAPASVSPVLLDAGQQAAIETGGRIVKISTPAIDRAVAWRQRHLEFRSATVAEVAAEFNRYNRMQIHVADEALAARRMSGRFEADAPQSLLDFLTNHGGVRLERRNEDVYLFATDESRRRRGSPSGL